MTRKDYQLIANVFAGLMADLNRELEAPRTTQAGTAHVSGERAATISLAWRMAEQLRQDNIRFDQDRFLEACNIK